MITFENAKQYKGKKIRLEFTEESIEYDRTHRKEIEENNKWWDGILSEIGFFEKNGLKD